MIFAAFSDLLPLVSDIKDANVAIYNVVTDIKDETIEIFNKLDSLSGAIGDIANDVHEIKGGVASIQTDTASMQPDVSNISQNIIDGLVPDLYNTSQKCTIIAEKTSNLQYTLSSVTSMEMVNVRISDTVGISGSVTVEPGIVPLDVTIVG